jgi:hypothetical protein
VVRIFERGGGGMKCYERTTLSGNDVGETTFRTPPPPLKAERSRGSKMHRGPSIWAMMDVADNNMCVSYALHANVSFPLVT